VAERSIKSNSGSTVELLCLAAPPFSIIVHNTVQSLAVFGCFLVFFVFVAFLWRFVAFFCVFVDLNVFAAPLLC
jgi:hypothetical protein